MSDLHTAHAWAPYEPGISVRTRQQTVSSHGQTQSGQDEEAGEDFMPYDEIDWETACNDFHPAFALVRGERYEPDAKPIQRLDRGIARAPTEPGMRKIRLAPLVLSVRELAR